MRNCITKGDRVPYPRPLFVCAMMGPIGLYYSYYGESHKHAVQRARDFSENKILYVVKVTCHGVAHTNGEGQ